MYFSMLYFLPSFPPQVKFVFEVFRRLRPGIPLLALYGKQKQLKRVAIYNDFCRKTQAVLLATDIAARGLGKLQTKSQAQRLSNEGLGRLSTEGDALFPRVINLKFPVQPHQKCYLTQYEELGFS